MKRQDLSVTFGLLLVGIGVLALLQSLGLFGSIADLVWSLIFAAGGIAFVVLFGRGPANWWAIIPGGALLGIASVIGLTNLFPASAIWAGSLFLGWLSLSFWLVYLSRRAFWWAIIPAGVLATLALIAGLTPTIPTLGGFIFFAGISLTFGLIYALPAPGGHRTWAIYPAGIALAFALLTLSAFSSIINLIWPAALILLGGLLLYRSLRPAAREKRERHDDQTLSQPH